jgi:hypothetical protein
MSVPDRQRVTTNLLAMLASGTGKQVGDSRSPLNPVVPYLVVFPIAGGSYWGAPLVHPDENAEFVYQIDSVGAKRDQVEWLADRARRTMLARTPNGVFQVSFTDPAGWHVADRMPYGGAGSVQVEGRPPNEVYSIAERFVLSVVPA